MKTFTESEMRLAQAEAFDEGFQAARNAIADCMRDFRSNHPNPYDREKDDENL